MKKRCTNSSTAEPGRTQDELIRTDTPGLFFGVGADFPHNGQQRNIVFIILIIILYNPSACSPPPGALGLDVMRVAVEVDRGS